jgi:pimeloyl-ACP methyl ester carboxylesterase
MQTLLLPGMDGTGRLFAPFVKHLDVRLEPRIVAYPERDPLSYDELIETIAIPEGPFAIVAESFSGPLAIRLAARHADRVCALALSASFVRNPSNLARLLRRVIGPRLFRVPPPSPILRWALLGWDAPESGVRQLREVLAAVSPEVLAHRIHQIVAVDVARAFASLSAPTLYLAASRDHLVGVEVPRELERLLPSLRVETLDAPHLVLQRRPAEAAAIVSGFVLAQLPAEDSTSENHP